MNTDTLEAPAFDPSLSGNVSHAPLYKLADHFRTIVQLMYDAADEETGAVPEEIMVVLRGAEANLTDKVTGLCQARAEIVARFNVLKEEEDRIARRRKSLDSQVKWLEKYLLDSLTAAGYTPKSDAIEAGTWRVKMCKSPAALEIFDLDAISSDFDEMPERKVNKQALKEAVKQAIAKGEEVPGARMTQGTYLRIS